MSSQTSVESKLLQWFSFSSEVQLEATNYQGCGIGSSSSGSDKTPRSDRTRSFACPEPGCGAQFYRKFTRDEQLKSHTGEKPFVCDVEACGRCFSTSGNMSRHRRLHKVQRYQCPASGCARVYTKYDKLTKHYKVHLGSAAYPCSVIGCTKSFATSGNLTRHRRKHHQVQSSSNFKTLSSHEDSSLTAYAGPESYVPITSPALPSDGITDQDLLKLLQCLFVDDQSSASMI